MLRIGDAFGDQILHAPGYVVLHLVAPLFVAGVQKLLAVSYRAAEVRLQHRVTAIRPELSEWIVAPTIARPRSTMRENHDRQILRRGALRQREVSRNLEPIR